MSYYQKKRYRKSNNISLLGSMSLVICLFVVALGYIYRESVTPYIPILIISFFISFVIILVAKIINKYHIRNQYVRSSLYTVDKMSGEEFEEYCAEYFRKAIFALQ